MPLREFICPIHGKFEMLCGTANKAECPVWVDNGNGHPYYCQSISPVVEFSVPAKRNPRHGEG
jgi:hypothetical protein